MNINFGPLVAALRHLGSYAAGFVTAAVFAGMNHDDAVKLANAIVQAGNGAAEILTALGIVSPIVFGWWAARKATKTEQIKAVEKMPEIATIVVKDNTNGKLGDMAADATAHPNIVTETQNETDAKQGTKTPG